MYKKILVVVDDSPQSKVAIEQGIETACAHHANILFFGALSNQDAMVTDIFGAGTVVADAETARRSREQLQDILATACADAEERGVHSFRVMAPSYADTEGVVDAATRYHCDLIVVGAENRNALMRLLSGSLVPGLITASSVPVLVCKDAVTS